MSKKYWDERLQRIAHKQYNKQEKQTAEFLKTYKKAYKDILGQVAELYMRYAEDGQLSMTELYKFKRYEKMLKGIRDTVQDLGIDEKKFATELLKDIYTSAAKETGNLIEIDFSIIPKAQIEKALTYPWSGADYSSRIWDNKQKLVKQLKETITQGIVQGKSNTEMTKEIKDTMGKGAYESRRLVRTETMHVVNSAQYDTYKKAGCQKVQFWAAIDERTCDECGELHEKKFNIDDAPMLPLHPNCRCTYIPIVDEEG